jgi:hypothetical protein
VTSKGDDQLQRKTTPAAINTDAITFEDFLNGEFSAKFFNGSWWSDTELQWKDKVYAHFSLYIYMYRYKHTQTLYIWSMVLRSLLNISKL